MENKTICAISTPLGNGGIAIVRMSGKDSKKVLQKITKKDVSKFEARKLYLTKIETENFNDNALVVCFNNPNSYTGEDMVEIQCHGGVVIAKGILNTLIKNGAKLAEAGEFTKRAFLNGKISLEKCEGVIDMINAENEQAVKAGYNLLNGKLFEEIKSLKDRLTDSLAEIDVSMDYPEEDMEYIANKKVMEVIEKSIEKTEKLLSTSKTGKQVKSGINVLIIGKPNVGKSSLLNALLGYDRAIVTDIAGTTRDTVEESYEYSGMSFNLIDTAGIHESDNTVEKIGIEKAKEEIKKADIILVVMDASIGLSNEDLFLLERTKSYKTVYVLNKTDLKICDNVIDTIKQKIDYNEKQKQIEQYIIEISALKNNNIEILKQKIFDMVVDKNLLSNQLLITNTRHEEALQNALQSLSKAKESMMQNCSLDLVSLDIKNAWNYLGEITGETSNEEIVNRIFEKFCLGK
ncbi:MAG: tRNA uridine-5-carboxymethylaminomethyl(34) synthesis GTPase MnmE [Clostridiales bacterium]|nr:tRNA uridine-5-carboxymethylaminomethyl(34) synthesis GTPase MnmE [Candidatus Apopatousia equi]